MSDAILIWGASGHALVVHDILVRSGLPVWGFYNNIAPDADPSVLCERPLYYGEGKLPLLYSQGVQRAVIAIGDCRTRCSLADTAVAQGFFLVTAIHPAAVLASNVPIGAGTVIAAGGIVNPASSIGSNVIINTAATVDHECIIADGVHLSPGVHLGGGCVIGKETWIGIGSTIKDHVRIGSGCIIGAGSLVLDDIPDNQMAYGTPARPIRSLV